uniref:non-specific serine/threonine protein kinase n=1 Tax=Compsopogon caeruleus TaxID=31354 RepID=A0A6T6AZH9_9RHOD
MGVRCAGVFASRIEPGGDGPVAGSKERGVGDEIGSGRYRLVSELGRGGFGVTYLAEGQDGQEVVLKILSLLQLRGWKHLEMFEREARTLRSLRHNRIPSYVDSFEVDSGTNTEYVLVQNLAKGRSLQDLVDDGWRASEKQVRILMEQMLDVLDYLGSLSPPVIHRDIKPSNVVIDQDGDEISLSLVDFGSVVNIKYTGEDATPSMATMVGTFGYMAPEQFAGVADVQSDLYSAGATILFLLSGKPPFAFPQKRLKVDFRPSLLNKDSPRLADVFDVVERLMEPAPEDRFTSARQALDTLMGLNPLQPARSTQINISEAVPVTVGDQPTRPVPGSRIQLREDRDSLLLHIPPGSLSSKSAFSGAVHATGLAMIAYTALSSGSLPFIAFFLPVLAAVTVQQSRGLEDTLSSTELSLRRDSGTFRLTQKKGSKISLERHGLLADLHLISAVATEKGSETRNQIMLMEGAREIPFGSSLSRPEQEYIRNKIGMFLQLIPQPKDQL